MVGPAPGVEGPPGGHHTTSSMGHSDNIPAPPRPCVSKMLLYFIRCVFGIVGTENAIGFKLGY